MPVILYWNNCSKFASVYQNTRKRFTTAASCSTENGFWEAQYLRLISFLCCLNNSFCSCNASSVKVLGEGGPNKSSSLANNLAIFSLMARYWTNLSASKSTFAYSHFSLYFNKHVIKLSIISCENLKDFFCFFQQVFGWNHFHNFSSLWKPFSSSYAMSPKYRPCKAGRSIYVTKTFPHLPGSRLVGKGRRMSLIPLHTLCT